MRVSSMQTVNNYQRQLNEAYERHTKLMEQTDGNSLHRPSDDAVNYSKYLRYDVNLAENEQYKTNTNTAVSWIKTSDSAMVNIVDIFKTFKGKTDAAANDTNNVSDWEAISKEMLAEIQEAVSDANIQNGDRYVFAGQSDTTRPFIISSNLQTRGLPKTLSDQQVNFFSGTAITRTVDGKSVNTVTNISQMLRLEGSDGNEYYMNTQSGKVYTAEFVEKGFQDRVTSGQDRVADADAAGEVKTAFMTGDDSDFKISDYFNSKGTFVAAYDKDGDGLIESGESKPSFSVNVKGSDGSTKAVTMTFSTINQYVVTYRGDDKYISMTKKNGPQDQTSDTVNATGQDMFGTDIFDNADSGNYTSGCASLNNLLAVQAEVKACNIDFIGNDGLTLADGAHATAVTAETKLGARQQAYTAAQTMLDTQNTTITQDVTNVSATDVAKLSTDLMAANTLYQMSLAVGGRILPQSLADYLS